MMVLAEMADEADAWCEPPLVREMAELALRVISGVVVRSPVSEPRERVGPGATHELVARFGIKLRAPFTLLSPQRRPKAPEPFHEPEGPAPFVQPRDPRPKRA